MLFHSLSVLFISTLVDYLHWSQRQEALVALDIFDTSELYTSRLDNMSNPFAAFAPEWPDKPGKSPGCSL